MKRILKNNFSKRREVRHARIRRRVVGTSECPRLSIYRSLKGMVAQLINDEIGKTLVHVTSVDVKPDTADGRTGKVALSYAVGKTLAEKAVAQKIKAVVFDRGGYRYHGRVKALAEGARSGGLTF